MRILFFGDASSIHLQRWVNFFACRPSFEVALASWHSPSGLDPSVRVLNPMNPFSLLRLLGWRPDIVHAHYLSTYGFAAFFFVLFRRVPFVGTVWGSDLRLPRRLWRWLLSRVLRRMDRITCDAEFVARSLLDFGVSPDRIRVIFFGTDVERFRPVARAPNANPGVISCRSLSRMYDVSSLVFAAAVVERFVHDSVFVVAGDGPRRFFLEWLADGSGPMFVFPGRIRTDLWFPHMDVYVSTSPFDAGLSASTAEAMACGLPVVVTDVCENSRWVDEHCGVLFSAGDFLGLADALVDLIQDPSRRRRLGKIGRRVIVHRNAFDAMMARVGELYRKLYKDGHYL